MCIRNWAKKHTLRDQRPCTEGELKERYVTTAEKGVVRSILMLSEGWGRDEWWDSSDKVVAHMGTGSCFVYLDVLAKKGPFFRGFVALLVAFKLILVLVLSCEGA